MTKRARLDQPDGGLGRCPWTSARCPLRQASCYEPHSSSCTLAALYDAATVRTPGPQVLRSIGLRGAKLEGGVLARRFKLSTRELEVLGCLFEMSSDEAIAGRLQISQHTVRGHRKAIYRKLEVSSFRELIQRLGIRIRLEPSRKSG